MPSYSYSRFLTPIIALNSISGSKNIFRPCEFTPVYSEKLKRNCSCRREYVSLCHAGCKFEGCCYGVEYFENVYTGSELWDLVEASMMNKLPAAEERTRLD